MATHLQQLLRSLCWNTEWNYAVFWKLKHRARMVLTWEDAFYNDRIKLDSLEGNRFGEAFESLHDGHVAHDPVGLAVAKMSYHVYSLGEGIVGQVAVTGKHRWIFAGDHAMSSCSPLELCDGWQAQFAAGIKTIVVAAVVPYGVVQLGSLNKVNENLQLLTQIRYLFSSLQESACHIQTPIQNSLQNVFQMSDIPAKTFSLDVLQECLLDKTTNKENTSSSSLEIQSPKRHLVDSFGASLPGVDLREAMEFMRKNGLIQSICESQQSTDLFNDPKCGSDSYKIHNGVTVAGRQICVSSQSCLTDSSTLYDVKLPAEKSRLRSDGADQPSDENVQKFVASDPLEKLKVDKNVDNQPEISCLDALGNLKSSVTFSTGTELHEALGPAFLKQCYPWSWESENPEDRLASQMTEAMESSLLTNDCGTDHLLEAVVANFCRKDATFKSAKSFSTSESMLTTEKMPESSINTTSHTIGSSSYYSIGCSSLLEESTQNCLNSSESCSIRSSTSSYREPLVRPAEPGKPNKKRARPGESSRPRPRDRQLIQDRIKELRELVPNGSKCSIDSLLERTIKHMMFMQSVTKHAEKLSNCVKTRGCSNEMGVLGSGYEQGSSWAVEVGGHMKICPIVVENLNINGQMLIEMLCEDSDHFLEIAEAIRSLGLTILKGMTDNHGDKTWMRFVVESQSNRNLHRMDVLWSLVQLLQSKTTV